MKRFSIVVAVCIAVMLAGCRTYTPTEGKAAIEPLPSLPAKQPLVTKPSVLEKQRKAEEDARLKAQEAQAQAEREEAEKQKTEQEITSLRQKLSEANAENALQKTENADLKTKIDACLAAEKKRAQDEADAEALAKQQEKQRIEAEQEKQRLAAEQEQQRLASEEAKKDAAEAALHTLPPFDRIVYPQVFHGDEAAVTANAGDTLTVLFLPLSDIPWNDGEQTAAETAKSISDIDAGIIFLTGDGHNIISTVRALNRNATLFADGAIVSAYPMGQADAQGMPVDYTQDTSIRLSLINLPEYTVLQTFETNGDWQAAEKAVTGKRLERVNDLISHGSETDASVVAASLYEPSHRDWNSFSPIPYRQHDYLWPLSAEFEKTGFLDTYRETHFSEATDAGNTIAVNGIKERIDYLFVRNVLPLDSSVITIGPESTAGDAGTARYGIIASYVIP